jgi:TRAP-type C4-dicarboxylate transport system substrate-binding protein
MRLLETWDRLPEVVRKALLAAAEAASDCKRE